MYDEDVISEISIDDITPEAIGFAMELFFEVGALDADTVPIGMEKSRPGILLCVMYRESEKEKLVSMILKHTTTLGVRENISRRYTLNRKDMFWLREADDYQSRVDYRNALAAQYRFKEP